MTVKPDNSGDQDPNNFLSRFAKIDRACFTEGNLRAILEGLKTRNVSDNAVARACGVDRRLIPRWRDGTHRPRNFDMIFLIAVGLAVTSPPG